MKTPSPVTRRQFLAGLFTVGATGFSPLKNTKTIEVQPQNNSLRVNAMIRILQEHHMLHDDVLHEVQKANLAYAFNKINPSNHVEEAIAVTCSTSYQPVYHIVDEYVRRKNREKPLLPDHPVMMLKAWGVPDTYRMLIFREQINALLAELTGSSVGYGTRMYKEIMLCGVTEQRLTALLSKKYYDFGTKDIKVIYDAVCYYGPLAKPYTWCSSMVSRAGIKLQVS